MLRLLTLYDYVGYFVICESANSFSGKPKNLYYKDNEFLFTEFKEKIINYTIPEPPSSAYISNPANPSTTTSDFWQRNQIAVAIAESKKSDLILVSDVDEIPNPIQLPIIRKLCYYAN
jgi:beta-1,4-mannosyl-glycoprotein beta-1,4-N-acetylglucosaminyltransferase